MQEALKLCSKSEDVYTATYTFTVSAGLNKVSDAAWIQELLESMHAQALAEFMKTNQLKQTELKPLYQGLIYCDTSLFQTEYVVEVDLLKHAHKQLVLETYTYATNDILVSKGLFSGVYS
jgi:hypothetical protein